MAVVLLLATQHPDKTLEWFLSLLIAAVVVTLILLFCNPLRKILGAKGLIAVERLMGMLLTTVAIQMFLTGINDYFKLGH